MSSDAEAMIEVVDRWLAKIYPQKPTWREVADIVEQIGHKLLARSLKQVYVTGKKVISACCDFTVNFY